MIRYLLPVYTIWRRELVRFLRQRSRIVGAFGQPIIFWLILGSGFGESFKMPGGLGSRADYLEYFYPGILGMVILFTSIFSTFAVVEDKKERFLQGVLVAPVPRSAIVLGQILGGTTLALIQGILLLIAAPLAGVPLSAAGAAAAIAVMGMIGFALTGLGLLFAWRMESTQGFHAIMNLVLIPLWLLSGAVFPAAGAHTWLAWIMKINPLTYGMAALRHALYAAQPEAVGHLPGLALSLAVTALFGLVTFLFAVRTAGRG
ncbi:MAG: ABC transporter permease [bacterium]|nr:ABC transporter permease [bacterium]